MTASASTVSAEITVTSFHAGPTGGGILIGWPAEATNRPMRARISEGQATREPRPGETWRVTGDVVVHPIHGPQIDAEVALPLLPTGEGIIRWIATSRSIRGIGARTARRLWNELGEKLYAALQTANVGALAPHVGPAAAHDIVAAFTMLADEVAVLKAYDQYGVDARAAMAACALWGRGAIRKRAENPYCINVVEDWKTVDARALRLGMAPADDRRLLAAVAEACAARYAGREWHLGGNLANTPDEIARAVVRLLAVDKTLAEKPSRRPSKPASSSQDRTASFSLAVAI